MWAVLGYIVISLELLLARVSILWPEYVEDQLAAGSSHERRCAPRASQADGIRPRDGPCRPLWGVLTPARLDNANASGGGRQGRAGVHARDALCQRHQHLRTLANHFGATWGRKQL